MHIVLDGQPGPSWTILSEIQFHPVTNELAYLAESQDKRCVIIGKDAFEIAGDSLSDLVCNPATRQFAVQVYVDGGARLHTQQTTSAPLCSFITTLIYSQDGNHFAYAAEIDDRQYVLLDHEPGMAFDTIRQRSLTFSPDGSRLVYVAESEDQRLLVEHLSVQWAPYEDISWNSLRFSSNGAHFAYTACIDHRWHLIIDGTPSAPHDDVGIPVFSPDSEHLAYRVRDGEEWRVIIDERPASRALTVVSDPQFTTGNEDVVYLAGEGNQFRFVEVVRYQ
jgi:hypothetical protein